MEYDNLLTGTAKNLKPSGIRKFFDVAERIPDAIALGVGEPDFKTPWHIRQAAIDALSKGQTRYTSNAGLMPLRDEIASYMNRKFSLNYDPATEITVTVGGSEAIDNIIRSVVSFGDEVLIPEPSFVCYAPLTELAGGRPVILPTYEKDGFKLTPDTLKKEPYFYGSDNTDVLRL